MHLVHNYLEISNAYSRIKKGQPFKVTMSELSNILNCTARNTKIIISKMVEHNWVHFVSGLGRGNSSELTLLLDYEVTLQHEVQELVKSGQLEQAFNLIRRFGEGSSFNRDKFVSWLSQYFGYYVDDRHDAYTETLRLPIFRDINTLDPANSVYALDVHMISQIFNTLTSYDDETKEIRDCIAHQWRSNEDATCWTFYLRKGVLFHNGRELVAEDVKYTLVRLAAPQHKQHWAAQDIREIIVKSRYCVVVKLKRPNYIFLHYLSLPFASITPREMFEPFQNTVLSAIGTGPYRVTKRSSEICILEAFDHYFQGRSFIDRVEIIRVPDNEELVLNTASDIILVHTGEQTPSEENKSLKQTEDLTITGCSVLTINSNKGGILSDLSFRKALYHSIDRHSMQEALGLPRMYPAHQLTLSASTEWDKEYNLPYALDCLRKSSYGGELLHLFTYRKHAPDAIWLASQYKSIGISLEVTIVDWMDMFLNENINRADLILFETVHNDRIISIFENLESPFIRTHISEKLSGILDSGITKLIAQPIKKMQEKVLSDLEDELKEEYAFIYLVYKSISSSFHPTLRNAKLNSQGWIDFRNVWFET
ncbi:ABC transporter substrate-binding protein [Paenibacillus alginolyticus]|uniref:ABC transporter substrate-binding protein n=1 Tax=Paenibacillus alginolyticus TaxID=59839 RepID=UPI0004012C5E|nr:ABC transporter substrate-binding protein [Paenibacillus alginolyticus]MCY9666503.1 ABC transporter substrate-binding protein [Paenibacillus alginolyticus]